MERKTAAMRAFAFMTTVSMAFFGITGFASADSIMGTGPGSTNTIISQNTSECTTTNNNDVNVSSTNDQTATSGAVSVSGNTNAAYFDGWTALDPAAAQAAGQSFADWWQSVTLYMNTHTDASQWMGSGTNTSWQPSSTSWANWDPAVWEANGQSFSNWNSQLTSYLNSNASNWMLTWGGAGGNTTVGGATSGDVSNTNTTNFSIKITNIAPASASSGDDSCGGSVATGGQGGGGTITSTGPGSTNTIKTGGKGGGSYKNNTKVYYGAGNAQYARSGAVASGHNTSARPAASGASSNGNNAGGGVTVSNPPAGGTGGGSAPSAPASGPSISNTGPGSHNTITSTSSSYSSVTNNNNVNVSSSNHQSASSGSVSSTGNTSTSGDASGGASNGNNGGGSVSIGS